MSWFLTGSPVERRKSLRIQMGRYWVMPEGMSVLADSAGRHSGRRRSTKVITLVSGEESQLT